MLLSAILFLFLVIEAQLLYLLGSLWISLGASFYLVICLLVLTACLWRSLVVLVTFSLSGGFRTNSESGSNSESRVQKEIHPYKTMVGEILVVLYLYSYAQVFLPTVYKLRAWLSSKVSSNLAAPRTGPVIVLVHGFVCNAGLWGPTLRHLREHGFARVHTVNLDPFYRSMTNSLAAFETQLNKIMHLERSSEEVILIGHSMGGVLARVFQNRHPERVLAAISIGAPHAGTDLARLVSTIEAGPARPDTRWLLEFNAAIAAERDTKLRPALNIWSDRDNIVYPQGNAALNASVDCRLNGLGHLHLAFSKRALNPIVEFLHKQVLPWQHAQHQQAAQASPAKQARQTN